MAGFDPRLLPALLQLGQQIGGGFTSGLEHSRRKDREQAQLNFKNQQLAEQTRHNQDVENTARENSMINENGLYLRQDSERRKAGDSAQRLSNDTTRMGNEEAWRRAQLVKDKIRAFTGQGMVPDQATLQDPSALDQWTAEQAPKLLDQRLRLAATPGVASANARFNNQKKLLEGQALSLPEPPLRLQGIYGPNDPPIDLGRPDNTQVLPRPSPPPRAPGSIPLSPKDTLARQKAEGLLPGSTSKPKDGRPIQGLPRNYQAAVGKAMAEMEAEGGRDRARSLKKAMIQRGVDPSVVELFLPESAFVEED